MKEPHRITWDQRHDRSWSCREGGRIWREGTQEVWYGATEGDRAHYPDCRAEYVEAMSRLAYSTERVSVRAPLIGCNRRQVLALASAHDMDLGGAWSCYAPTVTGDHCGTCDSCRQARL